jgi:hypothetical protein
MLKNIEKLMLRYKLFFMECVSELLFTFSQVALVCRVMQVLLPD